MHYTVQPGDTLGRIARKVGSTVDALRRANPAVRDTDRIVPNQRLVVPPSPGVLAFPGAAGGGVNPLPPPAATGAASATPAARESAAREPDAREPDAPLPTLAWGSRVSEAFRRRLVGIADDLGCDPNHLMAAMAFETGESFSPSVRNAAGSGATGLIQFMPATATLLGTTTGELARLTAEAQLEYVAKYFRPYRRRLTTLEDVYMAILWPAAIGKPNDHVLFRSPTRAYTQNRGLDRNNDGRVTKGEAAAKVSAKLTKGLAEGIAG